MAEVRKSLKPSTKPKIADYFEDLEERSRKVAQRSEIVSALIRQNHADMRLNQYDVRRNKYTMRKSQELDREQRELDIEIAAVKEEAQILCTYQQEVQAFQKKVKDVFSNLQVSDEEMHQKLKAINKKRKKWMKKIRGLEQTAIELSNRKHNIRYLTKQREVVVNSITQVRDRLTAFLPNFKDSLDFVKIIDAMLESLNDIDELEDIYDLYS